jgi:erythronate-4-phosphate dehydrogenase
MKIVVDNRIPFINGVLEPYAEVIYAEGSEISQSSVNDADALIIRTRTKCNRSLLEGTKVRFVATATIGYDHIDTAALGESLGRMLPAAIRLLFSNM